MKKYVLASVLLGASTLMSPVLLATFLVITSALAESANKTTCKNKELTQEEAFQACARWAKDEPTSPGAYLHLGHTSEGSKKKLAYYARALELQHRQVDQSNSIEWYALHYMAMIHTELKDYDAARRDYDRMIAYFNNPETTGIPDPFRPSVACLGRASIYELKGDIPRARADLTKALELSVALKDVPDRDEWERYNRALREELAKLKGK